MGQVVWGWFCEDGEAVCGCQGTWDGTHRNGTLPVLQRRELRQLGQQTGVCPVSGRRVTTRRWGSGSHRACEAHPLGAGGCHAAALTELPGVAGAPSEPLRLCSGASSPECPSRPLSG